MVVVKNVLCSFCGCVCDDLEVSVEDNKITGVKYACALATEKFLHSQEERNPDPLMRADGGFRKVGLEEALDKAARILAEAKYPLLYGWSNTSCEAIKVGIELTEEVGGVLDNTATVCHGVGLEAIQDVGEPTGTLGKARHRADLIIYWGCNPSQAHIRHTTRYTAFTKGLFRSQRKDRKIVVVDVRKTVTSKTADLFLQIDPGKDYELLSALRMAVRDMEFETEAVAGVPVEKIEELAEMMVSCEFGMLFFGLGLTQSSAKNENIAAAISLVRDLNLKTKFLMLPMRGHYNVTGANKVALWQTGYPFAVDFSHGYPRFNPGETSAADLLVRGEVDAALVVASDPASHMPWAAVKNLANIPVAVVDPTLTATSLLADVRIPAAFNGIEYGGTVYRMDGVALKTRKFVEPPPNCLPDVEVLENILHKVRSLKEVA